VFDVDELVAGCRAAVAEGEPRLAVRDALERALAHGPDLEAALPATRAELTALHHSPELTILKVVWAPGMSIQPHDHRMWAAIAIYGGQEDNSFYRRDGRRVVPSGGKVLRTGDVTLLGDDVIHSVVNPLGTLTGAIHVYGGDFFARPRSDWDPGTLEELTEPVDPRTVFDEANRRLGL
jgi:predicted metal-dependent enzyme (double-stranded beta helix superfamily)